MSAALEEREAANALLDQRKDDALASLLQAKDELSAANDYAYDSLIAPGAPVAADTAGGATPDPESVAGGDTAAAATLAKFLDTRLTSKSIAMGEESLIGDEASAAAPDEADNRLTAESFYGLEAGAASGAAGGAEGEVADGMGAAATARYQAAKLAATQEELTQLRELLKGKGEALT